MWCDLVVQGCQCGVMSLTDRYDLVLQGCQCGVTSLTDMCDLVVQGCQCGVTWSYRGVGVV